MRTGKTRIFLLSVLALGTSASAATTTNDENPYAKAIVGRNVFALTKPQPQPVVLPPAVPPPRITLQGVTSILGRWQVLFKVQMPAKSGEPAREISCILGTGERQEEIGVVAIEAKIGTVTFDNHGTIQQLNLKADAATTVASK